MNLEIKEFTIDRLKRGSNVLVIGRAGSGGATLKQKIKTDFEAKTGETNSIVICHECYAAKIDEHLRYRFDYIFVAKDTSKWNKIQLYKYYGDFIPEFEDFVRLMDAITQRCGCMVIDNRANSNVIEDCVFWYNFKSI